MFIELPEHFGAVVDGHAVSLAILSESTVVLRIAGEKSGFQPYASYALVKNEWPAADVHSRDEGGGRRFSVGELEVEVRQEPFALRITRKGEVVFETDDNAIHVSAERPTALSRKRDASERIYGMGEAGETLDRSQRALELWNTDDWRRHPLQLFYCMIPFAIQMSESGKVLHGLFIDNPGRQHHDLGAKTPTRATYEVERGNLVMWLIFADDLEQLLERWTELTGRIHRPPLWALGYHQCRWSYFPESRVREIAENFRKREIPCDVIYLDIQYMDDFRVFTWDEKRFPEPERLTRDLLKQGFRTITIVDPGVKIDKEYDFFNALSESEGMFLREHKKKPYTGEVWPGRVHYPDFTNPELRTAWGEFQAKTLLDKGVAGVWNDMNEPSNFIEQKVPNELIHHDFGIGRTHQEVHQIYGQTMAQTSCEGMLAARPDDRPFVITRSGWAGVQRYALVWTGDNESVWNNMPMDIMLNLNMGLSGVSMVGCDIGGFGRNGTPELYARWIEWGVFQPFCRTHSAWETRDQEPWAFGAEVEDVARKMIGLRYQLLPYIYTCVAQASQAGLPINRPLFFHDSSDTEAHHIADEFLLGRDILVAPVIQRGMNKRLVYLPKGDWFHLWSGSKYAGQTWHIIEAPIGVPPVFIRAGAIIPMSKLRQHVGDGDWAETFVDVWPASEMKGLLIEDDGLTNDWRRGAESVVTFSGDRRENEIRIVIAKAQGSFVSPRKKWTVRLHSEAKVKAVTVDGRPSTFQITDGRYVTTLDDTRETREIVFSLG